MKKTIYFTILLLFSFNLASSQKTLDTTRDTIFYNSEWKKVSNKNYDYYRVISQLKKLFSFKDYYASGQIQMEGFSRAGDSLINQGVFNYYEENGVKSKTISYNKNKKNGYYELYYPNGNLKEKGNYKNDLLEGLNVQYFENGKIKREAELKKGEYHGHLTYYNDSGFIIGKGMTKHDGWIGKWNSYDDEGKKITDIFFGDIIKIKEEKIKFKSEDYIWSLFDKESYSNYHSYLIKCASPINDRKNPIKDAPELYLFVIKDKNTYQDFYLGIEQVKTNNPNIPNKNIEVLDTFQTLFLNNGIQETSKVYGLTDGNSWFYLQYPINENYKSRDEVIISQFIESIQIY